MNSGGIGVVFAQRILTVVVAAAMVLSAVSSGEARADLATQRVVDAAVTGAAQGRSAELGPPTVLPSTRILDTRIGLGARPAPVAARQTLVLPITGQGGVPVTNVAAVQLTVTVTEPSRAGAIVVHSGARSGEQVSTVVFRRLSTVSKKIVTPVGADGKIRLVNGSLGTVHLVADVTGYHRVDWTPPEPISASTVSTTLATSLHLQWTNPSGSDYSGVLIRRAKGSEPPASVTDGTLVTDLAAPGSTFIDAGLDADTQYSYSFFARDAASNFALPAVATATTAIATQPAGPLRWGSRPASTRTAAA